MLRYYIVKMLRCYDVTLLRCYAVKMLQCLDVTMLRCCDVTMLRPHVDFLYVLNETRPLSHGIRAAFGIPSETRPLFYGITAVFGVHVYTERNKAVESWNNGRIQLGIYN